MKRLFTFLLLVALVATESFAVRPLQGRFFVRTQSDGTQIVVQRLGDGHNGVAFYATQDGIALVPNANGDLCYASAKGNRLIASGYIAHEAPQRSSAEQTYVSASALDAHRASSVVSTRTRRPAVHRISSGSSSRNDGLGNYGQTAGGAVPSLGEFTMPVILVEFSDVKFQSTSTIAQFTRQYNEEGYSDNDSKGSVRDYFIAQSRGLFRPTFDVAAKVTLSRTRAYYGKDRNEDYIDVNLETFQTDVLNAAVAAGVDFSKYVYQGGVPCVIMLYAGQGEANSYEDEASDYLWPCEWDEDADFTLGGKTVHINSFFVGNEIQYDYDIDSYNSRTGEYTYKKVGDPYLEGIGTFCHEFGHALGLPDFYCTDYSHDVMPLGYWDIMDMGSYLNDGYVPIGHTAYEKNFLGWLQIRELTDAESIVLHPYESGEGDHAVLIRNDKDPKEYYIFENRTAGTWYPEDMSGGMFAVHVSFNASDWTNNVLNNTSTHLRMQVFAADGAIEDPYSSRNLDFRSDLFPGSKSVTQILNTGTPAMTAFTGNYMYKPIYRIALDGENVTFNFLQEEISTLAIGEVFIVDGIGYEVTKSGEVYVTKVAETNYTGDITIPASVVYDEATWKVVGIRRNAFAENSSITSLTIGRNVSDIEEGALRHTTALRNIEVDENNGYYESLQGALFTKHTDNEGEGSIVFDFANNIFQLPLSTSAAQTAGNFAGPLTYQGVTLTATDGTTATRLWEATSGISLRVYKGGTLTLSVPEGATLKQVVFTTTSSAWNITTASTGTLYQKTWTGDAQSVTFTNTGGGTFIGTIEVSADGIANATPWQLIKAPTQQGGHFDVPEGVTIVGKYALEDAGYTTVTLPSTLTTLSERALSLSTLTALVANAIEPARCEANPFNDVDQSNCTLYVPEEANSYSSATYWKDFFSIKTIATGIAPVWAMPQTDGVWYDLQGRPTRQPQRGIYIYGGQKVVR